MITVKQYAEERSISIQAVHQSMKGKYKRDRLVGHVQVKDGVKWLDEEAVRILDEARNKSPIVWEKADTTERIEQLEREREQLLLKIAAQADKIAGMAEWKADKSLEIAAAEQTRLLLDGTRIELEEVKADRERVAQVAADAAGQIQAAREAEQAAAATAQANRERAERAEAALAAYAAEVDAYNALGWWQRRKAKKPVAPVLQED